MAKKNPRITVSDLKVGKPVAVDTIKFAPRAKRGTEYQPIFTQMSELKPGQGFTVKTPEGLDPKVFHNRLNAALRRVKIKIPAGHGFSKRTTDGGDVAIVLTKID